jgi:membrane protein DedA with SNARE-associated domain
MSPALFANIFTDLTGWLSDFSANWWFLLIIAVIALLDSVIPIVPGETMVIIGGVAAGQGDYALALVILAGAGGAFLGDNMAYEIGDRMSGWIQRQADRKPKWQTRLEWAGEQIRVRGGLLLITARFIPGGRTALTVSSGVTHQPRRWFVAWIAVATIIWATYAALLGYIGGKTFEDNHTAAFLVAFGAALAMTVLIEVVRHLRAKYR